MKIYSKFNDYYDNINRFVNTRATWIRTESLFMLSKNKYVTDLSNETESLLRTMWFNSPYTNSGDSLIVIGFCGKVHIIICSYENRNAYIVNNKKLFNKENQYTFKNWQYKYNNVDFTNIFVEINSPIFILKNTYCVTKPYYNRPNYDGFNFVINPILDSFWLQSIWDPYTAHQEIEMFLENQLATSNDKNINLSDELMRDSKGFNEWSFKQRGTKKRKQKW